MTESFNDKFNYWKKTQGGMKFKGIKFHLYPIDEKSTEKESKFFLKDTVTIYQNNGLFRIHYSETNSDVGTTFSITSILKEASKLSKNLIISMDTVLSYYDELMKKRNLFTHILIANYDKENKIKTRKISLLGYS